MWAGGTLSWEGPDRMPLGSSVTEQPLCTHPPVSSSGATRREAQTYFEAAETEKP